jgi:hypothetical protein
MTDAQKIIALGGKPALYAMAPTDVNGTNHLYSSVKWFDGYIRALDKHRVSEWLESDVVWLATHSSKMTRPFDFDPYRGWGVDDVCMRGYEYYMDRVEESFGLRPFTCSTEGGVFSPKHMKDLGWWPDYDDAEWGELLVQMFDFVTIPVTPWTFSDVGVSDPRWHGCGWYDKNNNPRSPVTALIGE